MKNHHNIQRKPEKKDLTPNKSPIAYIPLLENCLLQPGHDVRSVCAGEQHFWKSSQAGVTMYDSQ